MTSPRSSTDHIRFHDTWPGPGHRHVLDASVLERGATSRSGEVLVMDHHLFGRMLAVGGRLRHVESDSAYVELAAQVPLRGSPTPPRRVLVLGGDDGALARELLSDRGVEAVVVAPGDPAVVGVAARWLPAAAAFGDPRVHVVGTADVAAHGPYDLIIADLFGSGDALGVDPLPLLAEGGVFATAAACAHGHTGHVLLPNPGWTSPASARLGRPEVYMTATALSPGSFVAFRLQCGGEGTDHRAPRREYAGRHYDPAVHRAAFALPTWWRGELAVEPHGPSAGGSSPESWWHEHTEGTGVSQALELTSITVEQSQFQKIEVFDHPRYGRVLALDDTIQGCVAEEAIYHELVAHVPLLGAARPAKRVLIVGGGDYGVAREVLRHAEVERLVMVEIDQRVMDLSDRYYIPAVKDPRFEVHVMDAAVYVADAVRRGDVFDCVIVDATDSTEPSATLWTDAFFANLCAVLAPDGVCVDSDILIAGLEGAQLSRDQAVEPGAGLTWIRRAKKHFGAVEGYLSRTPVYPGGYFAYFLYTKDGRSHATPRAAFEGNFYNEALHRGVFALPQWWRARLASL